jgi:hypothetical protein
MVQNTNEIPCMPGAGRNPISYAYYLKVPYLLIIAKEILASYLFIRRNGKYALNCRFIDVECLSFSLDQDSKCLLIVIVWEVISFIAS